jgi:hypothetical protein
MAMAQENGNNENVAEVRITFNPKTGQMGLSCPKDEILTYGLLLKAFVVASKMYAVPQIPIHGAVPPIPPRG